MKQSNIFRNKIEINIIVFVSSLSITRNSQLYLQMSPKDTEVTAMINTVEVPSASIVGEVIYQKFGDLELPEDEEDDGDYNAGP